MIAKRLMLYSPKPLFLSLFLLLSFPPKTMAADDMVALLPQVTCGAGWKIEEKPLLYDRDTLSDRINGEAELYFPYGFDRMTAARYASDKQPGAGMDVEIYRMGTPLDAFGIFAVYRQKDGRALNAGAESNLSGSQLFLYQSRYFVQIRITGSNAVDPDALAECARMVTDRMPGDKSRPPELSIFDRPEVIKGTERYLPQSLLGYDFLNRGIMADALAGGTSLQLFLLLRTTAESASHPFERYRSQLAHGKIEHLENGSVFLEGVDPLYGPVIILKKGGCLAGALKFSGEKGVRALLTGICR